MKTFVVRIITVQGSVIRTPDAPGSSVGEIIEAAFDLFDVIGISVWPA